MSAKLKTVLITGATDGIGLRAAKRFVERGCKVLLHGRSKKKLLAASKEVGGDPEIYIADLSRLSDVIAMAEAVAAKHSSLDVLVNNAGVLKAASTITESGHDIRFVVNTIAPYLLTKSLLPLLGKESRVINLSSAAQSGVNIDALLGSARGLADMDAYAQSKTAITAWSRVLAHDVKKNGPMILSLNPGSLLATKMVKAGFGISGNDINIGSNIIVSTSLDDEFASATGKYFDNDIGAFGSAHGDATSDKKSHNIVEAIETVLAQQ